MHKQSLQEKVESIAQRILENQHYVTVVDLLLSTGHLQYPHFDRWQRGQEPFLETAIQADRNKIKHIMRCFHEWANRVGLEANEANYFAKTCGPNQELVFCKEEQKEPETLFKTYYFAASLSEKQKQNLREKLSAPPELVVFSLIKESKCDKCGDVLGKGSFLFKEKDKALCMECAGLGDMVFLPSGDVKLTRRTKKYTKKYAVVVRFSHTRKRYERQGILVEEAALKQAESELESGKG